MLDLSALSREDLERLVRAHARNWLAHDGLWFLDVEEKHGHEEAVEADARVWDRFAAVEAGRLCREFGIPIGGGLDSLARALFLRAYATINRQEILERSAGRFVFRMNECRVQEARKRAGRKPFGCKPVGLVEFRSFARAVDPRIEVRCVHCPPDDPPPNAICTWEFRLP